MTRLFVGIKMLEKIRRLAAEWEADKLNWPARWLKADNLHLTLVPPFYDEPEKIMAKLNDVKCPAGPVNLRFHALSYGPKPPDYRLIWAVGERAPELEKLKTELEKVLGLASERRNFLPHLTLARFRPENFRQLPVKNLSQAIDWAAAIDSFVLFECVLKSDGAEYKVLFEQKF